MPNRLKSAVSPYLRSHADNPVDWREWGEEAFTEAAERGVPVLVSIGYSTCHWCHVMARESFSDPVLAEFMNEHLVAIKVDREEYPDVDASYLAAASAFTSELGWPLNVFVTPQGKPFYAGTYWPPKPIGQHPAFSQVLASVLDAWANARDEVEGNAAAITAALAATSARSGGALPDDAAFGRIVAELVGYEDAEYGGFGSAPKFPVATVIGLLQDRGSLGDEDAAALAGRALDAMAASALRDPVDGGFFRYSTRRDWTEPHYERMLYDNALLLGAYAREGRLEIAEGIASFLIDTLQQPGGGFASAQDSESLVDGVKSEGGYYALDAAARESQPAPGLDGKILTGWNGLAIENLALAGRLLARPQWTDAARRAADFLLQKHALAGMPLVRASIGDEVSVAKATLEDYGMFASALLELAVVTADVRYAVAARTLVDETLATGSFVVPGGADPVLTGHGLAIDNDPSEGAYPSGLSAMASAAHRLYLLTAHAPYLEAAIAAMELFAPLAVERPIAFGAALTVMAGLGADATQLVVVTGDGDGMTTSAALETTATDWRRAGSVVAVVTPEQALAFTEAGFELFDGRVSRDDLSTAYLCRNFVCALPVTDRAQLRLLLEAI